MDPDLETSQKNDRLEGKYANYFEVGHNAYEFIIDFGQYYSENEEAELSIRVVTCPFYAWALLKTLKESIATYERTYETIEKKSRPLKYDPGK